MNTSLSNQMKKFLSVLSLSVLSVGLIGCDDSALQSIHGSYACNESYDIVKALVDNTKSYEWADELAHHEEEVILETEGDEYRTSCRTEFKYDGVTYEQLVRIEQTTTTGDTIFQIYPAPATELGNTKAFVPTPEEEEEIIARVTTQIENETINTCTWQERSDSISFDCEVVDSGKNVTITNLSNGVVEVFENQYSNNEYVHTENGQYWIRGGSDRKSFFANGTAIHF